VLIGSCPKAQSYTSLVPFSDVVAEGDVDLGLDPTILGSVPLHKPKQGAVAGSVAQNRPHLVTLGQVVPGRPEPFVEFSVVRFEHSVDFGALEIRSPLQEEIEEIPAPDFQGQVYGTVPFEVEPIATLQKQGHERMLASLKGYLQGGLRSGALGDGVWHHLKRFPFSYPLLDLVQTPLATGL
jgi:hypothetical protein